MNFFHRDILDLGPPGGRTVDGANATLDRGVIGEIVQRIPSNRYLLIARAKALGGGRWRRCRIGDVTGTRVLQVIEDGEMCLCLSDIGRVLRERLVALGYDFPETTTSGDPIRHGLVIASAGLTLTLSDEGMGSGMVRVLEGDVRLVFGGGDPGGGVSKSEWAVDIGTGQDFHWRAACPRRFVSGDRMAVILTRSVVKTVATPKPWRLDGWLDVLLRRLHGMRRQVFGAPERWTTSLIGSAPIGGALPVLRSSLGSDAHFRLVRKPSRHHPR